MLVGAGAWLELAQGGRGRDDGGRVLPARPQLVHAQAGQLVHTVCRMLAADIRYFLSENILKD